MVDWVGAILEICPEAYVVGGAVRDRILSRQITDIDLVVKCKVDECSNKLASLLRAKQVTADKGGRTVKLVLAEEMFTIDITAMAGENIEEDCQRRDFTVNAMAMSVKDWDNDDFHANIIDGVQGRRDCAQGIIRMVSKENMLDDPLRHFRAFRLAGELNFSIDAETLNVIQESRSYVLKVAPERVYCELKRIFDVNWSQTYIELLVSSGILTEWWPEIKEMQEVTQNEHHQFDVWEHSWRAFVNYELILNELRYIEDKDLRFKLGEYIQNEKNIWLHKLCALIHDAGKPETRSVGKDGRVHFYGHEKVGSNMIVDMLTRLRFSGREKQIAKVFVHRHMYPLQLLRTGKDTRDYLYRYFKRTHPVGVWVLLFSLADHLAKGDDISESDRFAEHRSMVEEYLYTYFLEPSKVNIIPLLTGDDLMVELNLKPGKVVGRLVEYLQEQQARGNINTRREALSKARWWLEKN